MYTWPLINDNVTASDRKALSNFILDNRRLTNGPKVKQFEEVWSNWLGVKYSTMVNSGNSGNFISMAMVKHLRGVGEVIVPPLGWVSDVSSAVQLGMTVRFVDISLHNLAISADNIRKAINENTKAIVLVHCLGFNAINNEIISIAKEHNLLLIEDCCEAHGATYQGRKVGSFGDISIFSFYFGHHITTIEGGMVCVNDPELHDLARLFRSHGMTREASSTLQSEYQRKYPQLNPLFTFAVPGFNMRSTELNAVLGLEQMKRIDSNIEKRKKNLEIWLHHLDSSKYHTHFEVEGNSSFALPLILKNSEISMSSICDLLEQHSVEYRLGTAGGGDQTIQPYMKAYEYSTDEFMKNIQYVHSHSLYVGNHTDLSEQEIISLCNHLNNLNNLRFHIT